MSYGEPKFQATVPERCKQCPVLRNALNTIRAAEHQRQFGSYVLDEMFNGGQVYTALVNQLHADGSDIEPVSWAADRMDKSEHHIRQTIDLAQKILGHCAIGLTGNEVRLANGDKGIIFHCGSTMAQPSAEQPRMPIQGVFVYAGE